MESIPSLSKTAYRCDDSEQVQECSNDVDPMLERICYLVALIFGGTWAAILQFTEFGRYLADRRTYLTVVVGVGGCLAIFRPLTDSKTWERILNIFTLAAIGIVARSLRNELRFDEEVKRGAENPH